MLIEKVESRMIELRMVSSTETVAKECRDINITLKSLIGKKVICNVPDNWTVKRLMQYIEDREGVPQNQQRLVFNNEEINRGDNINKTLAETV